MEGAIHFDRPLEAVLAELKAIAATQAAQGVILARIESTQEKILMSQADINSAVSQENAEVADLATQDAAILAAQTALTAEIATLQAANPGVDTSGLVTATAALLTAQGADDSTVAALTASAAAPETTAATSDNPGIAN